MAARSRRSLLWFFIGRARSLYVATILGFVGVAGLVGIVLWLPELRNTWSLLIAAYMLMSRRSGFKSARALILVENSRVARVLPAPVAERKNRMPAHFGNARNAAETSTHSRMGRGRLNCGFQFPNTMCAECQKLHPIGEYGGWRARKPRRTNQRGDLGCLARIASSAA